MSGSSDAELGIAERVRGSLFGGALGDSLGNVQTGMVSSVDLLLGPVSDDTQLTAATCEAIQASGDILPERLAEQFLCWYRQSRLSGLGAATLGALRALDVGGHWAVVGRSGEHAAGNGAAMRIAPCAWFLDPRDEHDRQILRDVVRITHKSEEAYAGALAVLTAVRHAFRGTWDVAQVMTVATDLPDSLTRDRLMHHSDDIGSITKLAHSIGSSGYVAETVPLALLCATRPTTSHQLLSVLNEIASLSGDVDTIASIVGQISGARLGYDGLPVEVVERIPAFDQIRNIFNSFAEFTAAAAK